MSAPIQFCDMVPAVRPQWQVNLRQMPEICLSRYQKILIISLRSLETAAGIICAYGERNALTMNNEHVFFAMSLMVEMIVIHGDQSSSGVTFFLKNHSRSSTPF